MPNIRVERDSNRAFFKELFFQALEELDVVEMDKLMATRHLGAARTELEDARSQLRKRPFLDRMGAHILEFLRIAPIIPFEILLKNHEAERDFAQASNLLEHQKSIVRDYGGSVPGSHEFQDLIYLRDHDDPFREGKSRILMHKVDSRPCGIGPLYQAG